MTLAIFLHGAIACLNILTVFLAASIVTARVIRHRQGDTDGPNRTLVLMAGDVIFNFTLAASMYTHASDHLNWRVWSFALASLVNLGGLLWIGAYEANRITSR